MAEQVIDKINSCLSKRRSFIMLGGAGSGKTYTLKQTIDLAVKQVGASKICCVTYTNAAVDEIKRRCPYEKLHVGTIHDTLWSIISPYQKNLVSVFRELIVNGDIKIKDEGKKQKALLVQEVSYRDFRSFETGIFSHDDLLLIVKKTFEKYSLLLKIIADKFPFFFIDEFQDTSGVLVDICVEASKIHGMTVGLFGDAMQAIYLDENVRDRAVKAGFEEIFKADNYRCSVSVINLINQLRTDGISQQPINNNVDGSIKFLHSNMNKSVSEIKSTNFFREWHWDANTKELYLTHKLIAKEFGFENYLAAFSHFSSINRNMLALGKKESERHPMVNFLFQIARIIEAYQKKDYKKVLHYSNKKIKQLSDKKIVADALEEIVSNKNESCFELIDNLINNGILRLPNFTLMQEDEKDKMLLDNLENISFAEIMQAYKYAENLMPFSTQHNIKGLEFDNIFVYLDNAGWNQYNFTKFFSGTTKTDSDKRICERTLKLIYVCFSRAKKNLVVYFPKPNDSVIAQAKKWFGARNVVEI